MSELLTPLVNAGALIAAIVIPAFLIGGYLYLKSKYGGVIQTIRELAPTVIEYLPDELEGILNKAVEVGADYAESIDLDGQINKYMEDFANKSEAKLMIAVDTAVLYLETQLKIRGVELDIPQDVIKALIQTHVFNNRDKYTVG